MKGIVFVLLKKAMQRRHGESEVEALLAEAGLDRRFGKRRDYPDADLRELIDAAERLIPGSSAEVQRRLGRQAIGEISLDYIFEAHDSVDALLRRLDDWVHPEVQRLFPGAAFPDFEVSAAEEADLDVAYRSDRELCHFAEGLIEGTADRYGQTVDLEQARCTHEGDAFCRILVTVDP